ALGRAVRPGAVDTARQRLADALELGEGQERGFAILAGPDDEPVDVAREVELSQDPISVGEFLDGCENLGVEATLVTTIDMCHGSSLNSESSKRLSANGSCAYRHHSLVWAASSHSARVPGAQPRPRARLAAVRLGLGGPGIVTRRQVVAAEAPVLIVIHLGQFDEVVEKVSERHLLVEEMQPADGGVGRLPGLKLAVVASELGQAPQAGIVRVEPSHEVRESIERPRAA